jgi:predicted ATPase/DNA-binding winged helix-turn-helix (wHTH) protein
MTTDYRFGNVELRPSQRMLLVGGKESRIGSRAFDLLLTLVERRDRVVAKDELLDSVWSGMVVEENNLQVHISNLRKVLGPRAISTVPGRGYRFTAELEDGQAPSLAEPAQALAAGASRADMPLEWATNLPAEMPPLYGREKDVRALRALIESSRLVTVAGAGGIGKTSLAQAVAHQLRGSYPDGVWLADLAPVAQASLVPTSVATVLRVVLRGDDQAEAALAKALVSRRMLLLLDNCEHLPGAAAELAAALCRGAPGVTVLATSQEPLKVPQEQVYRLGPLDIPLDDSDEGATHAGAVALFLARARAADPGFTLAPHGLELVVDICRHLDGIPLAIELAAARVPLLGVQALRARLDERFRLLTGGSRLARPRHQTLRAALTWSHGLLTSGEQAVFRRVGVFAGSFDLASAQRVASDGEVDDWAVLDHLGALVDKSRVVADPGAHPRYHLLETTRVFALEKLGESGETDTVMRRYAQAVLAVFEESRRVEYFLPKQERHDRYLPDLDNARTALDWCAAHPEEAGLQVALTGAVAWIWVEAGLRAEGRRRTLAALSLIDPGTPPWAEAMVMSSWSRIAFPDIASRELAADSRAIELWRSLGDRQRLFAATCEQARTLAVLGDHAHAQQVLTQVEETWEGSWPPALRVPLLSAQFWLAHYQGRFEDAVDICAQLYELASTVGDRRLAFSALISQEQALASLDRLEESVARGRELIELMRQDRTVAVCNEGYVYGNLCMSLTELGQVDESLEMARRAWAFREQAGGALCVLDPFARLAFMRGRIQDAARILGRADMRYATSQERRQPVEMRTRERLLAGLRSALPQDALQRLMDAGAALDDDAAAALALRD